MEVAKRQKQNEAGEPERREIRQRVIIGKGVYFDADMAHRNFLHSLGKYLRQLLRNPQGIDHIRGIVQGIRINAAAGGGQALATGTVSTTAGFPSLHSLYAALPF
jgi:hypothetical protein